MSRRHPLSSGDIDAILPWSLIRAARKATYLVTDALLPFDLTPVDFGILTYLEMLETATQAELARMIYVRPQSIAPAVRALVDRGLVERPAEGGRGRPARLTLTSSGSALLDRAFPVVSGLNASFPGPPGQRDQAGAFLLEYIHSRQVDAPPTQTGAGVEGRTAD